MESPAFLEQSLQSVFGQTLRADEVVLVEDGPLTPELYDVVSRFQAEYPELKVIPLEKNGGLGRALNEGLNYCSHDLVVRADTDDISKPNRFELQVEYMSQHPEIDVCGASIDEFVDDTNHVTSTRLLPEEHKKLYHFGKRRNPINHPVVIFRKAAVESAGGYRHFSLFEDYYLWARMMMNGAKFHNLKDSLLFFRYSPQMIKRRGGWKYAGVEMKFQFALWRMGYINLPTMIENIMIRFSVRIIPNSLRGWVYSNLLRNKKC